ncbi:MAG: hypothetical protein COA42_11480 [Alteromonadaceae bacterium]|nr:MAG: hypothetical protein COA42_11480 [Alteromonadaceae bacterium]
MNKQTGIAAAIGVLILAAIGYFFTQSYFDNKREQGETEKRLKAQLASPKVSASPSPTATPLETEQPPEPKEQLDPLTVKAPPAKQVPALNESDTAIIADIASLSSTVDLSRIFSKEEIARKIVRSVYGLSEGRVVKRFRPTTSPNTALSATKSGEQTEDKQEIYQLDAKTFDRYDLYLKTFKALNNKAAHELYYFYSPILEQAYKELGLKGGSFHKSLLTAIDTLIETPETGDDLKLIRPSVMYKFHDPAIEALPASQKLLIRMGKNNRQLLKSELIQLRAALIKDNPVG